jgi:hypothetical protein
LAVALDVSIAELLEEPRPKARSRSSLEPSFNDVLEEERREPRIEEGQLCVKFDNAEDAARTLYDVLQELPGESWALAIYIRPDGSGFIYEPRRS